MQTSSILPSEIHLWDINTGCIEHSKHCLYYESWQKFEKSKIWESNWILGALPVYWIWLNPKGKEWQDFSHVKYNILTLIWLNLAPLSAKDIQIIVSEEDEKNVKEFLLNEAFEIS